MLRSAARYLLGRGDHGAAATGPSGARPRSRAAGRSSSPTTTTPTSTTRPRSCWRSAEPTRPPTGPSTGPSPGSRGCSAATAAGRPSTSTTPGRSCRELPFCDFGELIDPPSADVTAHVVEMLARLGSVERGGRPRRRLAPAGPGGRRLLVRALGRQLRLRHRGGRPGARRRRRRARTTRPSGGPSPGWNAIRTPTAAGARICARTTTTS